MNIWTFCEGKIARYGFQFLRFRYRHWMHVDLGWGVITTSRPKRAAEERRDFSICLSLDLDPLFFRTIYEIGLQ